MAAPDFNKWEANNLAAAVRGASGARDGTPGKTGSAGTGFDDALNDTDAVNTVTITRRGPNSSPAWVLNGGAATSGAGADLDRYSDKYDVSYDSDKKAVRENVPAPQSITGWFGKQFWEIDKGSKATDVSDDMETGRVVVYTNIGPGTHVRVDADNASTVQGVASVSAGVVTIDTATSADITAAAANGAFGTTFPTQPGTFKVYVGEDDTATTNVREDQFAGTFYGISGKYTGSDTREESPGGQRGGSVVDATTGTFTASATLTATFGGDANTDTDDKHRISGMVKDFMNDAGRDLGWTVMLNKATTVSRGTDGAIAGTDNLAGTFSGNTTGDGTAQTGSWNGRFYGPGSDDSPAVVVLPSGVAGEFDANFNDGYVAGAFGATR